MVSVPLTQASVTGNTERITQFIQDYKIQVSNGTIRGFQNTGLWPEEYNSFVGSETRNNLNKDPKRFSEFMHSKPEWYGRKFIYRPVVDSSKQMLDALGLALELSLNQLRKYIAAPNISKQYRPSTGYSAASFRMMRNNKIVTTRKDLDGITSSDTVQLVNTAFYASASERNAVYYAKVGGIMYYAAQQVKKSYPDLGVRFIFRKGENVPGATTHYKVPTITIGTRATVVDKIVKPGQKYRSRQRTKKRDAKLARDAASS